MLRGEVEQIVDVGRDALRVLIGTADLRHNEREEKGDGWRWVAKSGRRWARGSGVSDERFPSEMRVRLEVWGAR